MHDLQKSLLSFLQGQMVQNHEIPVLNDKALSAPKSRIYAISLHVPFRISHLLEATNLV